MNLKMFLLKMSKSQLVKLLIYLAFGLYSNGTQLGKEWTEREGGSLKLYVT